MPILKGRKFGIDFHFKDTADKWEGKVLLSTNLYLSESLIQLFPTNNNNCIIIACIIVVVIMSINENPKHGNVTLTSKVPWRWWELQDLQVVLGQWLYSPCPNSPHPTLLLPRSLDGCFIVFQYRYYVTFHVSMVIITGNIINMSSADYICL